MKNCLFCQNPFVEIHGHQTYCSEDCKRKRKNESRRKKQVFLKIPCENCGNIFEKKIHNARHCSEDCRQRSETERSLARRKKELYPARICSVCGEEYHKDPNKFEFCSKKCRVKDRITKMYEREVSVYVSNEQENRSNSIRYKIQKRVEYANKKAKQLNLEGRLRTREVREFFDRIGWKCTYCKRELNPSNISIDHIIPFAKGGMNDISNITPSCITCNKRKATKTPEEFLNSLD